MTFLFAILVMLQFCARLATWPRQWMVWTAGAAIGLSAWALLPYAWENSLMALEAKLQTGLWADNFTLLVSLDVLLACYIGYNTYRTVFGFGMRNGWVAYVPSILLLPAVFWMGAEFLNNFAGHAYWVSGLTVSLLLAVGVPLVAMLLRWALIKTVTIIEFGIAIGIALFAAVLLQPLVSAPSPTHRQPVELTNLWALGVICVMGFALGMALYYLMKKLKHN
jgi:hypothetical protein